MLQIPKDLANTIVNPKAFADGDRIDEVFKQLRKEFPLAVAQPDGAYPFWVVTRHADLLAVSKQNDLFHNGDRAQPFTNIANENQVREQTGGSPHLLRTLIHMDNPDHLAYRRLTNTWFQPQNLKSLEVRVRELAKGAIERMASFGSSCDFAKDVSFLYPLHVIMEILGVPPIDENRMLTLTQELFGGADPEKNRSKKEVTDVSRMLSEVQEVILDFMNYFNTMTEERRRNPRNDLASVIANGAINGQPLGHLEAMSYYIIVATAGHDTTSSTTAGAMWELAKNPKLFAKLKANPGLIPGFVEESLRWVTAVKHMMRSATADTELSGQKIAKGDWMMLCYPSANRDEEVFDHPFDFDMERSPNRHLAFGMGGHICLGQHLARMEMRIFWEELISRVESVELNGTPKNTESNFVCGPKTVPIRFKMN